MRPIACLSFLFLAGCGEAVKDDHFARAPEPPMVAAAPVRTEAVPVRVGELGPAFPACGHAGTTRRVDAGAVPVKAAPFETAAETGSVPAGARFFVCSRSHDQRWMGVVYEPAGTLSPGCGVAQPAERGAYAGPCRSGWVASAAVKFVAG